VGWISWIGCILMVSGWVIAMASLLLLEGAGQRMTFVITALLVEALGLCLVAYSYRSPQKEHA
jgi:hypothetical protein